LVLVSIPAVLLLRLLRVVAGAPSIDHRDGLVGDDPAQWPCNSATVTKILVGTSGWSYDDWATTFYPKDLPRSRWLLHYATRFPTVEVNNTFYRLPTRKAVAGWRSQVPDEFAFVVKGSRYLTHTRKLLDTTTGVERFFEPLEPLGATLNVVLWQLPPTLHLDLARLDSFLVALPGHVRHAVEFRHPSWQTTDAYALLARHNAMLVSVSGPQLPADRTITGGTAYVRFHGLRAGYAYDYRDEDLTPWADLLRHVGSGYAFFNNDARGHAVKNAEQLRRMLG
jgi:uncharacterized protein YecE (DUF72 family)